MSTITRPPDIEAEITLLPTIEGGRHTVALSGYRPTHDFDLSGMLNDAVHEYIGCDSIAPEASAKANMWFLAPDHQVERLYPGFKFTVQEGSRIVGYGVITKVFNEVLRRKGT